MRRGGIKRGKRNARPLAYRGLADKGREIGNFAQTARVHRLGQEGLTRGRGANGGRKKWTTRLPREEALLHHSWGVALPILCKNGRSKEKATLRLV